MSDTKPRRVKAKITRIVSEAAIVILDRDGNIEEVEEVIDELDWTAGVVKSTIEVLSVYP